MKKMKLILGIVLTPMSAAALAMPAAVPQIYYDHLPHRWEVLTDSPGFCGTPIGLQAPICWANDI